MPRKDKGRFIIGEPNVYVIGCQSLHREGLAAFLEDEGFPDWTTEAGRTSEVLCEVAGRLCYLSFAGGRRHEDYIDNLKRERHGSVLEHATINFILTGVSRSFTHECVRHRAGWAYSQLSQRYVDESMCQMVCPRIVAGTEFDTRWRYIYHRWAEAVGRARDSYLDLSAQLHLMLDPCASGDRESDRKARTRIRKLINGAARSLLPNATETKIACTVNARALRHFLEMRANPGADSEIRLVAMTMYRAALPFFGSLLGDYEVRTDEDGEEYLVTNYVKV